MFATVHPCFMLRLPDEDAKALEYGRFLGGLAEARALAGPLAGDASESRSCPLARLGRCSYIADLRRVVPSSIG